MNGYIHAGRIAALRSLMSDKGWDAVIVCGSDPHASEYPAPRFKQVEWLTGFTGEAGDVVITMDHAGLWTDSRYFIQADNQLRGTGVELHKTRMPDSVLIPQWLSGRARIVAVDGLCMSSGFIAQVRSSLGEGGLVVDVPDMLDVLWQDRPLLPVSPITTMDVDSFGGTQRVEKIAWLRKWMMVEGASALLLTSLDEIAWMLNVRGNDIEYNPLVISYLLVTQDYVKWFVTKPVDGDYDPDTVDSFSELELDGVTICEYESLMQGLEILADENSDTVIFADPSSLNYHVASFLETLFANIISGTSPVILEKAIKTESEISAQRQTYIDDGVAMETFLYWLENEVNSGREVSEWDASEKLTSLRADVPGYRGNSFENISAYGANAALPHYCTPREGSAIISPKGLYLVDSGGQYLTGTTDITRTVPMGPCSELEKEDYTLVLKGMIALSMARFPRGTAGCQIDVLARNPLWKAKRNFGHGTGHGIGFWLCVHEGPQDIRQNFNSQPLLPGMITSNEPGLYREGMHGIRHENVILCRESGSNEFGSWLEFETLTCCHIDTAAIIPGLLSDEETEWLNAYNESVYRRLSPQLPSETAAWLRRKTLPLGGDI